MLGAYYAAKAVTQEWSARGGVALVPNDDKAVLTDGAQTDGRPIISGAAVNNVVTRLAELVADYEADDCAKLNTLLAVATKRFGGVEG